jgi:uroporphyrinogen-III synthase
MVEPAVLVTRPEGQAGGLSEALAAQGYRALHHPMLEIHPLDQPDARQRQLLGELAEFQHIIFVSGNAVRLGMAWIEDRWPQLPVTPRWYAVGGSSAAELAGHGLQVDHPEHDMSSDGLLALPALQDPRGERVLIVKGVGGRDRLRVELERRGARVEELEVYERRCPRMAAGALAASLREHGCKAIFLSSGEGLNNMVSLLGERELDAVRDITLVAPGRRVADMARAVGFSDVVEAANASDAAMVAALLGHGSVGG